VTAPHRDPLNLVFAGVGGQGNILASQVVAQAALLEGLQATIGETYGVSQRGGSVTSHVRLGRVGGVGPQIPRGEADVLVGFEPLETFAAALQLASSETRVLCNPRPVPPIAVLAGDEPYPPVDELLERLGAHVAGLGTVPATDLARQAGEPRAMNLVMVGALARSGLLPIPPERYEAALAGRFSGRALAVNREAFRLGYEGR